MILPTKGIGADRALLSIGADILRELKHPKTVSRLWEDHRKQNVKMLRISFDWFVLALDFLYAIGVVELTAGRIHRIAPSLLEPHE